MNNIEKILDYVETTKKLLGIIPLFFVLGVMYQFIILLRIEQIWIFSWNQVINDTLKISMSVIFGQFLFFLGINNLSNKKALSEILLDILGVIVVTGFIIWITITLFLNSNENYINSASTLLGVPYFCGLLMGYDMRGKKSDRFKKILLAFAVFLFTCIDIARIEFQDLYLKIYNEDTCKSEIVLYANDKYIITKSGFIYQNNDNIVFYRKPKI